MSASKKLNRFELVAKRIAEQHGVSVEWAGINKGGEYLVEGVVAKSARTAKRIARDKAKAANHLHPAPITTAARRLPLEAKL